MMGKENEGWKLKVTPNVMATYKHKTVVYFIKCDSLNKIYIGSAADLNPRMKDHFGKLYLGQHANKALQAAYNEFGLVSFRWGLLGTYPLEELETWEQYWIDKYSEEKPFAIFNAKRIVTKIHRRKAEGQE
jgi:group I intron endonuclease